MIRKALLIGTLMTALLLAGNANAQSRSVASDTLSGAAKGAVIGAIAGDAGKGAAGSKYLGREGCADGRRQRRGHRGNCRRCRQGRRRRCSGQRALWRDAPQSVKG